MWIAITLYTLDLGCWSFTGLPQALNSNPYSAMPLAGLDGIFKVSILLLMLGPSSHHYNTVLEIFQHLQRNVGATSMTMSISLRLRLLPYVDCLLIHTMYSWAFDYSGLDFSLLHFWKITFVISYIQVKDPRTPLHGNAVISPEYHPGADWIPCASHNLRVQ